MRSEIYLAGGCFWGTEKYLSLLEGVLETRVGYANGLTQNPSYEDVCYRNTGHAETVKVIYDNEALPLRNLLQMYFRSINPVSKNRQGNDIGTQYRTGIYYIDEKDKAVIEEELSALQENYEAPVAVECLPLSNFFDAEEYHQKYLEKNPNGYCHIKPGLFEEAKNYKRA